MGIGVMIDSNSDWFWEGSIGWCDCLCVMGLVLVGTVVHSIASATLSDATGSEIFSVVVRGTLRGVTGRKEFGCTSCMVHQSMQLCKIGVFG